MKKGLGDARTKDSCHTLGGREYGGCPESGLLIGKFLIILNS